MRVTEPLTEVVVDACAIVELVRATPLGSRVHHRVFGADVSRHIHDSCSTEVVSALRGLVLAGKLDATRGELAVLDATSFPAHRHRGELLLPRTWELRANLTTYDALYVALAESLDAALVTTDRKFDTSTVRRLIDVQVIG